MSITGNQIRAARVLLDWKQEDLSKKASVGITTIRDKEAHGRKMLVGRASTNETIQRALERAGIEFLNGTGSGVRLKKRQRRKTKR